MGTYDSGKWVGASTTGAGIGRVSLSGGSWANDSYIGRCGLADVASGTGFTGTIYGCAITQGTTVGYLTDACQVLGVENPWGNVWTRVVSQINDGLIYYKTNSPASGDYATTTGWTPWLTGSGIQAQLPTSSGFAKIPLSGASLTLPATTTGGGSNSGMFDYYYYASGLRTLLAGGTAAHGVDAGAFSLACDYCGFLC